MSPEGAIGAPDSFAAYLPALPFLNPLAALSYFVNQASNGSPLLGYGSLFFNCFFDTGAAQTAPTPTGSPVGTDGTYWELYDNGDAWTKRTYINACGELIKEEWGYHTQTLHELRRSFNQLIEDAGKNTAIESKEYMVVFAVDKSIKSNCLRGLLADV